MPARRGAWAVYQTFETADREQLLLGITSNNHFRAFCDALGRPDLSRDPRLVTNSLRVEARPWLIPEFRRSSPSGPKRSSCVSLSRRTARLRRP
jgi:crotonobetainyl-CoA:carnitine CoA-transferase CaiB-like acyl-CoA transferase